MGNKFCFVHAEFGVTVEVSSMQLNMQMSVGVADTRS